MTTMLYVCWAMNSVMNSINAERDARRWQKTSRVKGVSRESYSNISAAAAEQRNCISYHASVARLIPKTNTPRYIGRCQLLLIRSQIYELPPLCESVREYQRVDLTTHPFFADFRLQRHVPGPDDPRDAQPAALVQRQQPRLPQQLDVVGHHPGWPLQAVARLRQAKRRGQSANSKSVSTIFSYLM